MTNERRYPIGIQTFSRIRREGYVYVDKTDLVWQLTRYATFIFLSRPRRFGKSLLTSTLESYFLGERELFEGLKIMEIEQEWTQYPVMRFDLSGAKHLPPEMVKTELGLLLDPYEETYGANPKESTPGMRLSGLIDRAFSKTGKQVVVIIDEYDAPLLDVLHEDDVLKEMREVMQEFYQRLKKQEAKIKFCFITGITKFSQLSIFSTINNLKNISMLPRFSTLCGITDKEIDTQLKDDIAMMAEEMGSNPEEMREKLRLMYDGYHFTENSPAVYNPYSLFNSISDRKLSYFWFSTGTPTFLLRQMAHFHTDITAIDDIETDATQFDVPTEAMASALPLLYQSGYLTIKDYDAESDVYTLSIPNKEVRVGFTQGLLPTYIGMESAPVKLGFALKFWNALKKKDTELAMQEMRSYLAQLPYIEGFKKKLAEVSNVEGFYEWSLYLIFSMLNVYVVTQQKCAGGRVDMVVHMPDTIYVVELKINGTAQDALDQINSRNYALQYATSEKKIVKVGVSFSTESKTIEDWIIM